jgi:hypothetical protein
MVSKKESIAFMLVVLAILAFSIGFIYSWDSHSVEDNVSTQKTSSTSEFVEILGEKEISSQKVIVSDKFVQTFDPNGNIVVLGSDGSAYNVRNGVVLVSGVLIDAKQGSSYSVRRLDDERKSMYN